jgi:argininosuccinate lyase
MVRHLLRGAALAAALALMQPAAAQPAAGPDTHDAFYWLSEINKASAVMVTETRIVPRETGAIIASAIARVIAEGDADPSKRSGDYLRVEPLLTAAGGPEVTRLHSGRSRQDIGATSRRLTQRVQVLATLESLDGAREKLLAFAAQHPNAIVPAYTWGVQAQPISMGHYILAYTEALEGEAARLRLAFASANRSPLGAAALGTSSFPVDRDRLARLLGFDGAITNSLYANQISPIDTGVDLSSVSVSIALVVGTLVSDLEAQYRMATPWLTLSEGELTGVSSIMPQKRNPVALQQLRVVASGVVGDSVGFYIKAHNVPAGMGDYKGGEPEAALKATAGLLDDLGTVVGQLRFNAARALEEVNADYSATTELADILQREANVPFRVGHHFASELVTFGRAHGLRPAQIRYADARRIYAEAARQLDIEATALPLNEAGFRRALSAENMVASSKGLGGPQAAEVARMLAAQRAKLAEDRAWLQSTRARLATAASDLQKAFDALQTK